MKKYLVLLLCICTVFSSVIFASCEEGSTTTTTTPTKQEAEVPTPVETLNGQTPIELYSAAVEEVEQASGIEFSTVLTMEMLTEGKEPTVFTQSVIVKSDLQNSYVKTTNDKYPDTDTELWFVDGTLFVTDVTGNHQLCISASDYREQYAPEGSEKDSILLNCPEKWFENATLTKDELENYCLEFVVSGKEYWDNVKDGMITSEIMSLAVQNVDYKVYFDEDGNLTQIVTEFEIVFGSITTKYTSTTDVNLNAEIEITAPEGSENWENLADRPTAAPYAE
ncbi:MAG: hypothetical protein ACI3XL_02240 [Eubacteriales bacterium]